MLSQSRIFWQRLKQSGTRAVRGLWRPTLALVFIFGLSLGSLSPRSLAATTNYYVNSARGSDSNPGTSPDAPWRTLAPVNAHHFVPGDAINLARGSSWTGNLNIDDSGAEGSPIIYRAYGSGDKPVLINSGQWSDNVTVNADWTIIDGLYFKDAGEYAVDIQPGAEHNIVRNSETNNVGFGVGLRGSYNHVTDNYFHDHKMIVNTSGGDDDYGANGVIINGTSNNEVSYNRMINCRASSYDYGTDGGAIEIYGNNANDNYIHHNFVKNSNNMIEVGGGSSANLTLAYNVTVNNGYFSHVHLQGGFASQVSNMRVINNTIIEDGSAGNWQIFSFNGTPSSGTFKIYNNAIYANGYRAISGASSISHANNIYQLAGGTQLGFSAGSGEKVQDPLWVNRGGGDFHLQPGSPARDAGMDVDYSADFEGKPVPSGPAPDMGAFEYQGAAPTATPQATPTVAAPTATPTRVPTVIPPTAIPTRVPTVVPPTAAPTLAPPTALPPTATPTRPAPTTTPTRPAPTATPTAMLTLPAPTATPTWKERWPWQFDRSSPISWLKLWRHRYQRSYFPRHFSW